MKAQPKNFAPRIFAIKHMLSILVRPIFMKIMHLMIYKHGRCWWLLWRHWRSSFHVFSKTKWSCYCLLKSNQINNMLYGKRQISIFRIKRNLASWLDFSWTSSQDWSSDPVSLVQFLCRLLPAKQGNTFLGTPNRTVSVSHLVETQLSLIS